MKESRFNIWTERNGEMSVFNGVSGSLVRMSMAQHSAFKDFISGGLYAEGLDELLTELAQGRMIVPDDADELALLERRYTATRDDRSLFSLTIVPSLGCNFDCPYCFEAKHPSLVSRDTEAALLRILGDQIERHIVRFHVTWFGGEPLVGKRALLSLSDAFIEQCAQNNVDYDANILTNGYLLDEETCRQLKDRRVLSAQIGGLDGPPDVHDKLRPLRGGKGSFWHIVENLHHASEYLNVAVRVNVHSQTLDRVEELFQILVEQGFSGKVSVYPGQIVGITEFADAPSASYQGRCLTNSEFAEAEIEFLTLAQTYGLASASLPRPSGAPCTAVRRNELVVGSRGELYKCWNNVGNPSEVVGHVSDYNDSDGRLQKWLKYDPFQNEECRQCIALPVCMGGCAHHAMSDGQYANRCGTFRHTYHQQVANYMDTAHLETRSRVLIAPQQLFRRAETR